MERRILIMENDADSARHLANQLEDQGYSATVESSAGRLLGRAAEETFDLLILHRARPGLDGLEICRQLRAAGNPVPIFILGDTLSELDRVLGLEMGADDYLANPLSLPELSARVKALFRRVDMAADRGLSPIRIDGMSIDVQRHEVTMEGRSVSLTAKEFDLLCFLARHPGRVFTRGQLLESVWGYGHEGYEHTVNSHINRLRNKIEPDPAKPRHILTVWSVGYKFSDSRRLNA